MTRDRRRNKVESTDRFHGGHNFLETRIRDKCMKILKFVKCNLMRKFQILELSSFLSIFILFLKFQEFQHIIIFLAYLILGKIRNSKWRIFFQRNWNCFHLRRHFQLLFEFLPSNIWFTSHALPNWYGPSSSLFLITGSLLFDLTLSSRKSLNR